MRFCVITRLPFTRIGGVEVGEEAAFYSKASFSRFVSAIRRLLPTEALAILEA